MAVSRGGEGRRRLPGTGASWPSVGLGQNFQVQRLLRYRLRGGGPCPASGARLAVPRRGPAAEVTGRSRRRVSSRQRSRQRGAGGGRSDREPSALGTGRPRGGTGVAGQQARCFGQLVPPEPESPRLLTRWSWRGFPMPSGRVCPVRARVRRVVVCTRHGLGWGWSGRSCALSCCGTPAPGLRCLLWRAEDM